MSAEVLRRAAGLMRERAEAATDGPWVPDLSGGVEAGLETVVDYAPERADATHIASWHPVVALAVADWLSFEAEHPATAEGMLSPEAMAVARAYLGEQS